MNYDKTIKVGAIAWGTLSFFSAVLPVLHEIPDLMFTLNTQNKAFINLPKGFTFPYLLAGIIYEPIMVICILLFGIALFCIWKKTGLKISLVTTIITFIYGATRVFWAWVDITYAESLEILNITNNWENFASASMFKGLGAGINGTIGIILAVCLILFFTRTNKKIGKIGALIVLCSLIPSIIVKTLSISYFPYIFTGIFSIFMTTKSVGIGLSAIALYRLSD